MSEDKQLIYNLVYFVKQPIACMQATLMAYGRKQADFFNIMLKYT